MGEREALFPGLEQPGAGAALLAPGVCLDYAALAALTDAVAAALGGAERVAVWATPGPETCVAVLGALRAGVTAVPLNPRAGSRELGHVVADSDPDLVLHPAGAELPPALAGRRRAAVSALPPATPVAPRPEVASAAPALVLYTSGTTGAPKGVVVSRRALAADVDGLAAAWEWTAADVVAHSLPLFHAHGLVLGVLGPLRLGGTAMLLGRFSPTTVAAALRGPATVLFGVPTMYRRLRLAAAEEPAIAAALARARLLVSGSAPLPAREHAAIERLTGQRIVERYGMTETLITIAARSDGPRAPGSVGVPVPGVEVRLVGDDGAPLPPPATETVGELQVRGPTLFDGYLNLPGPTRDAFADGWLKTGDIAVRGGDGSFRIVGRRQQDLIKTGGYRVGAGEVEAALADHPAVAEVAVTGAADPDLGQRIVAWVVPREEWDGDAAALPEELAAHVSSLLAAHKRPRQVHLVAALPRNELGKVMKSRLGS